MLFQGTREHPMESSIYFLKERNDLYTTPLICPGLGGSMRGVKGSLPQLPSSKRCDHGVGPSFAFSVPGDLVHFEFSPGALALPAQSFHQ